MRIVYASGLLDPLSRPLLRLVGRREIRDELLPAAMFGRGIWMGRLPDDLREIWISPTLTPGPFAFRVERFDILSSTYAFTRFAPHSLARIAKYMWGHWQGLDHFARLQSRRALGATPRADYAHWRHQRRRLFDPLFDDVLVPSAAPAHFHILAKDSESAGRLQPMLAGQIWPHWTLGLAEEARFADSDYVLPLAAQDQLEPHALAVLAAHLAREGACDALYADEDRLLAGQHVDPLLKPDWSPAFFASGYAGTALALRGDLYKNSAFDLKTAKVSHSRRILISRPAPHPSQKPSLSPPTPDTRLAASILIPTRDRMDLLQPCLESLKNMRAGVAFEIIVLDNSAQHDSVRTYFHQSSQDHVRALHCPGAFNFSALCNTGARVARYPFLLFLNNDVEVLAPDWLAYLLALAAEPRVGAVGAKLLYPNGRLQHGGIVLGLDGFAGHLQRGASREEPGYLNTLAWPREVAAVTGACLAVEARKFFEVGGFDEVRLPVEYNDVDLCLRLSEHGYANMFEPRALLLHHESATRGTNPYLDSRYANEHSYFRERWSNRLRDDIYFHPALSLDVLDVALG